MREEGVCYGVGRGVCYGVGTDALLRCGERGFVTV